MRATLTLAGTLLMLLAPLARAGEKGPVPPADDDKRPLVMFIGDSLSVGGRGHPNQKKYPRWSYVEAIKVLAEGKGSYRFDKRAAGGQSICGKYRALYRALKSVTLGGKKSKPVEGLAFIVFQDSATGHKPTPDEYEKALREIIGFVEKRPGVKLVLCTTAFERLPEKRADLAEAWKKVNEVMIKLAGEKKLGLIRQDIYWQRYVDWYLAKKLPLKEEKHWRLTGPRINSVHPGLTGSIFMAMQIARELGIPAGQLDVDNPDLPIEKARAEAIRDFVYSWTEPTVVPTAPTARAGEEEKKPLVVFVGDSITNGRPTGRPDYKPSEAAAPAGLKAGHYGYVEALVEATVGGDAPYRFYKLGSGGQAITGWIGTACRQILESRNRSVKEMPAILVVQDYLVTADEESQKKLEEALRKMAGYAAKAGDVRLVWSTVVTDPQGSSGLKKSDADVKATNEVILKVAEEMKVPVVRLDIAWARYVEFTKGKANARDWVLTRRGKIADGVHPGTVGALFQALVFARELGIPAEAFDETAPALGVEKAMAAEIEKLVYSWTEPTVVPRPAEKAANRARKRSRTKLVPRKAVTR